MTFRAPSARTLILVAVTALLLRLAAVLAFPVYPLVDNTEDTEIYDSGAHSLAAGQGYRWNGKPTAFFPVGWPLLLSLAYRVGGASARTGQVLNLGLSLALLAAGWLLARRLFDARVAALVLLVMAVAPHMMVYPAFLMSEVAFTAFFTASLACVAGGTAARPVGVARLAAGGLLMGVATLIRGLALVFPLVVVFSARFSERRAWNRSLLAGFVFGLALLVPLAPWAYRNHQVFGRWVLVANDGGMNFLMGNHVGATGARHEPAEGLPDTGDEIRDDREGYRRGLEFIRQHPLQFVRLWPMKFVRLTAAAPLLTFRAELLAKWPAPLAYGLLGLDQLLHVALWLFAALGLWGAWRRWGEGDRALALPLGTLGLWIAVHLAFLGGARYFFPMMPLLIALAAWGVVRREDASTS